MGKQSFVRAREIGPLLKHYTEIYIRLKIENIVGDSLKVNSMQFNEELRRDFVEAVEYVMKFVLMEDTYFANKMKKNFDTLVTSVTNEVVSKREIMTSIAAHEHPSKGNAR